MTALISIAFGIAKAGTLGCAYFYARKGAREQAVDSGKQAVLFLIAFLALFFAERTAIVFADGMQ